MVSAFSSSLRTSSDFSPLMLLGMVPSRLLCPRSMKRNRPKDTIDAGKCPDMSLLSSARYWRLIMLPMPSGMAPPSWFCPSHRSSKFVSFVICSGIAPLSWLPFKNSHLRLVKLPISGGSVPWSPFSLSEIPRTRPLESTLTPCHDANGWSESQLVLSFQLSP